MSLSALATRVAFYTPSSDGYYILLPGQAARTLAITTAKLGVVSLSFDLRHALLALEIQNGVAQNSLDFRIVLAGESSVIEIDRLSIGPDQADLSRYFGVQWLSADASRFLLKTGSVVRRVTLEGGHARLDPLEEDVGAFCLCGNCLAFTRPNEPGALYSLCGGETTSPKRIPLPVNVGELDIGWPADHVLARPKGATHSLLSIDLRSGAAVELVYPGPGAIVGYTSLFDVGMILVHTWDGGEWIDGVNATEYRLWRPATGEHESVLINDRGWRVVRLYSHNWN